MAEKIGLKDAGLPTCLKRSTPVPPYAKSYDDETTRLVAERYVDEIELFGYRFSE